MAAADGRSPAGSARHWYSPYWIIYPSADGTERQAARWICAQTWSCPARQRAWLRCRFLAGTAIACNEATADMAAERSLLASASLPSARQCLLQVQRMAASQPSTSRRTGWGSDSAGRCTCTREASCGCRRRRRVPALRGTHACSAWAPIAPSASFRCWRRASCGSSQVTLWMLSLALPLSVHATSS